MYISNIIYGLPKLDMLKKKKFSVNTKAWPHWVAAIIHAETAPCTLVCYYVLCA